MRSFQSLDGTVSVEADDQPATGFASPIEQGDMAGMDQIEATVSETDTLAFRPPHFDLVESRLERNDLAIVEHAFLRAQAGGKIHAPDRSSAWFTNNDSGRSIGKMHRIGYRYARAHGHGQSRCDRIASAGDIEDLAILSPEMLYL